MVTLTLVLLMKDVDMLRMTELMVAKQAALLS